ncbi:MAG: peptidylprolyl isomerase [Candidatus Binatia bacterium]
MFTAAWFPNALRWPIVAGVFGAVAALILPRVYEAATDWWSNRGALVVIDGQAITRADLEHELTRRGLGRALPRTGRVVLDDLVELETLTAAARRAGYADDPDVRLEVKHALAGRYRDATIEGPLSDIAVTNQEIGAYYDANPGEFTLPEAVHAAVVRFAVPAGAPEERQHAILERAEQVRQEALGEGADFARLAVRYSDDQATRYRGGDVGWVARGQKDSRLEPAVIDAAFALAQPGEVGPLVPTATGIHLIKLLERKPERMRPLIQVKDDIRARVLRSKRAARERELHARAVAGVEVRVHEERIAELGLAAPDAKERGAEPPQPWMAQR